MGQRDVADDLINLRAWTDIVTYSNNREDCINTFERILETMNRFYSEVGKIRGDLLILRFRDETRDLIDVIIRKLGEQSK